MGFKLVPCLALYLVSFGFFDPSLSTKSATHWRLSEQDGVKQIVPGDAKQELFETDPLFDLLVKANPPRYPTGLSTNGSKRYHVPAAGNVGPNMLQSEETTALGPIKASLTCGTAVLQSPYDHLEGIAKRGQHPLFPEPEVALIFKKNEFDDPDLLSIEANLKEAVMQGENKVILFNQVGNFLRIKGHTYHSIECFRSALALAPDNPDVLLNLARVLHNLKFYDDAIYLTQHSLEFQSSDQNAWLQYFTLGEILKSRGEIEKATEHFRNALSLNPSFIPAEIHLKELGYFQDAVNTDFMSVIIIAILITSLFPFVYFTILGDDDDTVKPKRRLKS
eukprot:gene15411-16985_t